MSDVKLGEIIYIDFTTSNITGHTINAVAIPQANIYEDANATLMIAPTVSYKRPGHYSATVNIHSDLGFESGKSYNVIAAANMSGTLTEAPIGWFVVRGSTLTDIGTAAVDANTAAQTAATQATAANAYAANTITLTSVFEGTNTVNDLMKWLTAVTTGKATGANTGSVTFYGLDGTTARVTMTVDSFGNRTAVTRTV